MPRKNCLIKLSGDSLDGKVLEWIEKLTKEYFVVVCVGGGTQINEAFKIAGFDVGMFGPMGRETKKLEEKQLARDVLERNQQQIQDKLALLGVHVSVVIPVIEVGTVLCHVNGDQFLLSCYNGFEKMYVVTTAERLEKKKEQFSLYPKIEVIGF
jgi:hypothetical protein